MTEDDRAPVCLPQKEAFRSIEATATASHFDRLPAGRIDTAETSSLHLDALRDLMRINAHLVAAAAVRVKARCCPADCARTTDAHPEEMFWATSQTMLVGCSFGSSNPYGEAHEEEGYRRQLITKSECKRRRPQRHGNQHRFRSGISAKNPARYPELPLWPRPTWSYNRLWMIIESRTRPGTSVIQLPLAGQGNGAVQSSVRRQ